MNGKYMAEYIHKLSNTADAIVVGGGAVGLHTAHALHETMGNKARIVAITQESEWGGIAGRSLEQFRLFNDSFALAEIVSKGIELYRRVDEQLQEKNKRTGSQERAYRQFPYIFTVGPQERPEHISELLPVNTPKRPNMAYYEKLKNDTISWGFDPQAEIVSPDELQRRFPLLNGDAIEGAMIINSAGRLHFDIMRNWIMEKSRADGNGRGVTYLARTAARQILLGKKGEAIGIDLGDEKIYSDKIILALGSFALKLPQILPGSESDRIASNFTITQRELFFSNTPGVHDTNFFLISPDMAIARVSTHEGHACYGYASEDDPIITAPSTDPRPNDEYVQEWQINRKNLMIGRTYTMLSECSTRWDSDYHDPSQPNLAIEPFGHSAGYYSAYRDGLPVVGKLADAGVILAVGSHHSGIMGGQGIAELAVDHALGQNNLSQTTHQQTNISRTPVEHAGLVL